jgi:hypothetical protein
MKHSTWCETGSCARELDQFLQGLAYSNVLTCMRQITGWLAGFGRRTHVGHIQMVRYLNMWTGSGRLSRFNVRILTPRDGSKKDWLLDLYWQLTPILILRYMRTDSAHFACIVCLCNQLSTISLFLLWWLSAIKQYNTSCLKQQTNLATPQKKIMKHKYTVYRKKRWSCRCNVWRRPIGFWDVETTTGLTNGGEVVSLTCQQTAFYP